MVINAGVRVDFVNYNTQVWADPTFDFSPNQPWFYLDWGYDGIPWIDGGDGTDIGDGAQDGDYWQDFNGDGVWQWVDLDEDGQCDQGVYCEPLDWYTDEDGFQIDEIIPDSGEGNNQYDGGGNGQYDGFNSNCELCGNEEYQDINENGQ